MNPALRMLSDYFIVLLVGLHSIPNHRQVQIQVIIFPCGRICHTIGQEVDKRRDRNEVDLSRTAVRPTVKHSTSSSLKVCYTTSVV